MLTWIITELAEASDQSFLLHLYEDNERLMFSTVRSYTDQPEDQQDIVQTALVKLIQKTEKLRSLHGGVLSAYVVITVRNTAIDFLRRQAMETSRRWEGDLLLYDEAPPLDQQMMEQELGEAMHHALAQLSETDQRLLTGKYILEESDRELAEALGCTPASIRMKLTRARKRALTYLENGGNRNERPKKQA